MTGRTLGVALILWPFASALLLGIHRAGRALRNRYTRRSSTVTFAFTDCVGDRIDMHPMRLAKAGPAVSIAVNDVAVWIPVDQVEELVAGLRDTARQAAAGGAP